MYIQTEDGTFLRDDEVYDEYEYDEELPDYIRFIIPDDDKDCPSYTRFKLVKVNFYENNKLLRRDFALLTEEVIEKGLPVMTLFERYNKKPTIVYKHKNQLLEYKHNFGDCYDLYYEDIEEAKKIFNDKEVIKLLDDSRNFKHIEVYSCKKPTYKEIVDLIKENLEDTHGCEDARKICEIKSSSLALINELLKEKLKDE